MTRFLGIENRGALVVMLDIGIAMPGSDKAEDGWPFDEHNLRLRIKNLQDHGSDVSVESAALAELITQKQPPDPEEATT